MKYCYGLVSVTVFEGSDMSYRKQGEQASTVTAPTDLLSLIWLDESYCESPTEERTDENA
jgi:hypothetical protein